MSELESENKWVFTELAESINPIRKQDTQVPLKYLKLVKGEYVPYKTWVKRGFIKKIGE